MKKLLLLIFVALAFAFTSNAQSVVRWRTSVKMTSPSEGQIVIKALISEGWHLYAFDMPEGGPKATKIDFSDSRGITIDGEIRPSEAPVVKMDPLFGKNLSWWDRNVSFTQNFTVNDRNDSSIKVSITYMCCNGGSCTAPKTETMTASIPDYNPSELNTTKK